jgi:NAD(P)-dependent dehydrogenase (short-subunit alcohol dehydrogenase family)
VEDLKRACLLTGASGGLGRAFLERCAGSYRIVAVHHRAPIHFATQNQVFVDPLRPDRELPENADAVHAVGADLTQPEEVARVAREALDVLGGVDLLLNAAAERRWAGLLEPGGTMSAESLLAANVIAPLRLAVELAARSWGADPDENVRRGRSVLNVSSTAGLYVYPDLGQALYATSKAALNHLTHHMASEFWDLGIRVNAIAPDSFPGRVGIEEVLDAVLELDRSEATGEVIPLERVAS